MLSRANSFMQCNAREKHGTNLVVLASPDPHSPKCTFQTSNDRATSRSLTPIES